jgi:hypothetical protein
MGPPPPLGPKEVTTTQFQIKRTTQGQKCWDKEAKAFVGDELDDQGCPNTDEIIDIDGQWCIKCLVIRHVRKAMIVEVHTIDTSSLGDPHNDDDDSMH